MPYATTLDSEYSTDVLGRIRLDRGAQLTIARPFPTQDARWPASAQSTYAALVGGCVAAGGAVVDIAATSFVGAYTYRDRWMVDRADAVIAVWDGGPGGTGRCVAYARRLRQPLPRIVPGKETMAWERFEPPDEPLQPRLPLK